MRNLKKILAMVLALVMSLSLMATAGAADFKDQADISEKYQTAVEVLRNLEVFNGYAEDNTFRPENSITREEVAAIIYRIATGDVKGASAGIYADYNIFKDVTPDRWSAGYINFCANAEYIKGHGNGNFDPKGNVTGYEALAMILRAIGYTANGGFSGPEWHLQTGRVAEARGITKNVQMGTLGEPASRQTVAELLFQSILVNMVNYDQRTGYYELEQSLGYKVFQLEELEGVVVANEFANLNTNQVLAEGKTQIQVADETNTRTLNISSDLTDIGESRYVYTQDTSKVLAMGDTGKNVVKENNGAATDISSASKFQSAAGMPQASDIEFYVNFDRVGTYTCDQRLEFSVTFQSRTAESSFCSYAGVDISKVAAEDNENLLNNGATDDDDWTVTDSTGNVTRTAVVNGDYVTSYPVTYHKIIRAGLIISQSDLDVIYGIFGAADNTDNNYFSKDAITGDVFVGTVSTNPTLREEEDLSNKISFNTFFNEYINDVTYDTSWVESYNGEWVKFIDNDNDGRCEYAFLTLSTLDEVMDTYTKDGNTILVYNDFSDNDVKVRYLDGTPALGDKVLYSVIDNQILVEPAKNETVKVSAYSWRDDQITTDKGTYGQSGIYNSTEMQEQIDTMDENVEYIVYFDHFGYVRAYELATKPQYALVTEIYGNNVSNGNLVNTNSLTIELAIPNSDTSVDKAEYVWTNPNSDLRALVPWTTVRSTVGAYEYYNYLQPAISHLGVTRTGFGPVRYTPVFTQNNGNIVNWTFWNKALQNVKSINALGQNTARNEISGEFNYGSYNYGAGTTPVTTSFTNIGIASVGDGKATVTGAAQLKLNKDGSVAWYDTNGNGVWDANERARYAVDYVQLSTNDVVAKSVRYGIDGDPAYVAQNNNYVNAVDSTEYYIIYDGGVVYFKGFNNFPGLNGADNTIHAAYAVARDTSADNSGNPYWVADVIVYEVKSLDNTALTSVALAYYTPNRTSGSVQQINTLNSKYGPLVQLVPGNYGWNAPNGQWGADYAGYGFYALYNDTEPVDNVMTASRITRIQNNLRTDGNYGKNNIHAGIVTRVSELATGGAYIDVAVNAGAANTTNVSLAATDQIYSITSSQNLTDAWYGYNEANLLRYNNIGSSQVKVGDLVIWVGEYKLNSDSVKSSANFIVDLGNTLPATNPNSNLDLYNATPTFLTRGTQSSIGNIGTGSAYGEWQNIMDEQSYNAPTTGYKVTVKYTSADPNFAPVSDKVVATVLAGSDYTVNSSLDILQIPGYTITAMSSDPAANVGTLGVIVTSPTSVAYTNIDRDVTVTVTYAANNVTVSGGTISAGVNVTAAQRDATNSADVSTTPITAGVGGTSLSVAPGTWVGLTVTTAAPLVGNQSLKVTVDGTVVNMTNGGTYYFQMPNHGVVVDAEIVGNGFEINVVGGELAAPAPRTVATTYASAETVTLTAAAGYNITGVVVTDSITGATVTPDVSSTATIGTNVTPFATGTVVLPASTNKNVTITVTTAPVEYTVGFDTSAWTSGQVWYALNDGADVQVVSGTTTVTVSAGDVIHLKISGTNAQTPIVGFTAASNGAGVVSPVQNSGTNYTCDVSGIYATTGTAPVIEIK